MNKDKAKLTSAQTDTETGNEGLSSHEDNEKSIEALKVMKERGLISDEDFETRLKELQK